MVFCICLFCMWLYSNVIKQIAPTGDNKSKKLWFLLAYLLHQYLRIYLKKIMPLFLKLLKKTLTFGGHFLFLFWVGLMWLEWIFSLNFYIYFNRFLVTYLILFFKDINKHFSKFIWNHKMPRINLNKLMKPKEMGGVALPNLRLYFWSAQVKHMVSWYSERTDSKWFNMEATACAPLPIKFLPFIINIKKLECVSTNFIISNTLLTWGDIKKYFKIPANITLFSPIAFNPDFPVSLKKICLSDWSKLRI